MAEPHNPAAVWSQKQQYPESTHLIIVSVIPLPSHKSSGHAGYLTLYITTQQYYRADLKRRRYADGGHNRKRLVCPSLSQTTFGN